MTDRSGRYSIVYNGELYNYLEIKRELSSLGMLFRTTSDTEVVLEAFARWGAACLDRFVGMFAFAILDHRSESVFVVRDHLGIKPVYRTETRTPHRFCE